MGGRWFYRRKRTLPKETFSEKETEGTEENSVGCRDGTSLPLFTLNSGEFGFGVAEAGEFYAHFIHDGEVEAAEFAIVIAVIGVVEDAATRQGSAEAAERQDGQFRIIMAFSRPHVR